MSRSAAYPTKRRRQTIKGNSVAAGTGHKEKKKAIQTWEGASCVIS
jgi:hypothetical protein